MFPNDEDVKAVAAAMFDPFEYLILRKHDGLLNTDFKQSLGNISYHIPCHLRVQNIGKKTKDVLELVPETQVNAIERCSGHDGTWGVKSEYFADSMKIGKPVFKQMVKNEPDFISSDCAIAARHIEQGMEESKAQKLHPLTLIRMAYGDQAKQPKPAAATQTTTDTTTGKSMTTITRDSLLTLEAYAKIRQEFRAQVMAHKKNRRICLGDHITLIFEDELTMRYQIQEMLRIEKLYEEQDIIQELETYTPLIPDGSNWKATMMIEYADPIERATKLATLVGIEQKISMTVAGHAPILPIADEDLERDTEEKTSAVHFLRFELTQSMIQALQQGAALSASVDHPNYQVTIDTVDAATRESLLNELK